MGPGSILSIKKAIPVRNACDEAYAKVCTPSLYMSKFRNSLQCCWTGGRVVECTGLENRSTRKGIVSSNLTLSV